MCSSGGCGRCPCLHEELSVGATVAGHQVIVFSWVGARWGRRKAKKTPLLQVLMCHCPEWGKRGHGNVSALHNQRNSNNVIKTPRLRYIISSVLSFLFIFLFKMLNTLYIIWTFPDKQSNIFKFLCVATRYWQKNVFSPIKWPCWKYEQRPCLHLGTNIGINSEPAPADTCKGTPLSTCVTLKEMC